MYQNHIPKWALAAVAVLLLVGLGSAIHNAGWSQGFTMGLLAGNADGNTLAPYLASRTGYGGFFGGFFRFAFFLFVFAMIARFFGFWRWSKIPGAQRIGRMGRMPCSDEPWRHHYGQPRPEQSSGSEGEATQTAENKPQNTTSMYV